MLNKPGGVKNYSSSYSERGYYLVMQFRDESRRASYKETLKLVRAHSSYVCLMQQGGKVLHRITVGPNGLEQMPALLKIVANWSTVNFFLRGFPITGDKLIQGINCYLFHMGTGKICNPFERYGNQFMACPHAKLARDPDHENVWYKGYRSARRESGFRRPFWLEEGNLTSQFSQWAGCPLFDVRKTIFELTYRLPKTITLGGVFDEVVFDSHRRLKVINFERYQLYMESIGLSRQWYRKPKIKDL